jgi:hypothetical protein
VVSTWLQCDHPGCLKWRIVPDLPGIVPEADEPWYCELNRDPARNTCEAAQQPDDAMLDEAVLALLAEAEPDQDVDELGGLPPPPPPTPPPPLPPTHALPPTHGARRRRARFRRRRRAAFCGQGSRRPVCLAFRSRAIGAAQ